MQPSAALSILKQYLVVDRKQRTAQGSKHRELIVWPLDRCQGGPQRLDFVAFVVGPAADQHVRYAASFQRLRVRSGRVVAVVVKTPEKNADVMGLHWNSVVSTPLC